MPKEPVRQTSSGFALALDTNLLNRAKASVEDTNSARGIAPVVEFPMQPVMVQQKSDAGIPSGEPANIHRQVILTETAAKNLDRLVEGIASATKCRGLTTSHVMRALMGAVDHAHEYIVHEVSRTGIQKVPRNTRGFEAERDRLEAIISAAIVRGFRDSPAADKLKDVF